jgi:predicted transcriptional regulator
MTTQPFSLRLDADTRARLEAEARRLDRPAAQVVARAITRWLDAVATLRSEIDAAVAEAEAGAFVSSEAVAARNRGGWRLRGKPLERLRFRRLESGWKQAGIRLAILR